MFYCDATTMYDVDFHGVTDEDLFKYLDNFGTYFCDNMYIWRRAVEYLNSCPVSREACLLRVCFRWFDTLEYFRRLRLFGDPFCMSEFRQHVYAAAVEECSKYMLENANVTLKVGTEINYSNANAALKFVNNYFE